MNYYLGVDIGGTAVKMGIVDARGTVYEKHSAPVSFDDYATPIIDTVVLEIRDFLKILNGKYSICGIGVSATGQIDSKRGCVAGTCGNIKGYVGTPIKDILVSEFCLPVTVVNDANCMCMGEAWTGAAKGVSDVIGITLGTGVGGGIITGGRLLSGARGLGGEIGHFSIDGISGETCTCGQKGCFEHQAATTALVRKAKETGLNCNDGKAIFDEAAAGSVLAAKVIDGWLEEIAVGVAGLIHIFNPSLVVIGGGVSAQDELLMKPLREKILLKVMPAFAEGLHIEAAKLQNDAGLIGAVRMHIIEMGE